ncbi:TPA: preferentially expressed antigen in melanoma-like [Bos taurus]|nr:TPA: preferentially expressed antigen in melanoma-like [Bos taurus]
MVKKFYKSLKQQRRDTEAFHSKVNACVLYQVWFEKPATSDLTCELAAMSLVRDEALAISSLEYLPMELYPPLFMAAFSGRHSETLKAMVQAWPFARLPLGGLMQKPHQGTIQAVLDGLDVLLAQKVHPRRCKLRVLDLRNTGQDFWNMWSGDMDHVPSSSLMAPVAEDMSQTKHPLTPLVVYIELCLKTKTSIKFLTYLLRWVEQRKGSMHLCCKKIKIISRSKENIKKILSMVKLNCVQEVELSLTQKLSTLAKFASLLGKMRNVQRLLLSPIHGSVAGEQDHQALVQFTSQILRLQYLRDLRMEGPSFLEGRLNQMLRCLKTSLYNISITNCLLTESDLTHLSQCWNICQLKGLNLNGVTLTNFHPELLQVLLEKVAGTLEELDLNLCGIMDSHLMAILPVLSSCSQLRVLSLCGNLISMTVLKSLLRHTDRLSALSLELYPAPRESYSSLGILHQERLAQLKAELWEFLTDLGRPRKICVSPSPCPHCGDDMCDHLSPSA